MRGLRVVWPEKGRVELEEFDVPSPSAGQVLVRALYTLVSAGTERAFLLALPNTPQKFPACPGYNGVGEVLELGKGVEEFSVGQRVVGLLPHASHSVLPASALHKVPKGVPLDEAVFFNLASISLQGVRKAQMQIGESVAVIGLGLIGLFALQFARLSGAAPVIGVDKYPHRLRLAEECGADETVLADGGEVDEVRRLTEGGAHVVVDATDRPEVLTTALEMLRQFGRLVLLGSTRGEAEKVNFYRLVHRKGATIIGAHASARPKRDSLLHLWTERDDWRAVLKLMALGRLKVRPLISLVVPPEEAPQVYRRLVEGEPELVGILFRWGEG